MACSSAVARISRMAASGLRCDPRIICGQAETLLAGAGVRIVTTNSIPYPTNAINVPPLLTTAINELAPPHERLAMRRRVAPKARAQRRYR
jgi:hypothetical protein